MHSTLPGFLAGAPGHRPGEGSAAPQPICFLAQKLGSACKGLCGGPTAGVSWWAEGASLVSDSPCCPSLEKRGVWPSAGLWNLLIRGSSSTHSAASPVSWHGLGAVGRKWPPCRTCPRPQHSQARVLAEAHGERRDVDVGTQDVRMCLYQLDSLQCTVHVANSVTQICPADQPPSCHQKAVPCYQKDPERGCPGLQRPVHLKGQGRGPLQSAGPLSQHPNACWRGEGSQAPGGRPASASTPESPGESGSSWRMDRLPTNAATMVLKAGPPRHVLPMSLEVPGPARVGVPPKGDKSLLSHVVSVAGTRPRGHRVQSSEAPRSPLTSGPAESRLQRASSPPPPPPLAPRSSRLPQNRRPADLNRTGPWLYFSPACDLLSRSPPTPGGLVPSPWLRPTGVGHFRPPLGCANGLNKQEVVRVLLSSGDIRVNHLQEQPPAVGRSRSQPPLLPSP